METLQKEILIKHYLSAYNKKNVEEMMEQLDENVLFENFSSGEKTHSLAGKTTFQKQAEEALAYFSDRRQSIKSIHHLEEETEVEIDYWAILAIDFPNGMKKGQELRIQGKSVFRFSEGKISSIQDFS